jgi:hypothetical protein
MNDPSAYIAASVYIVQLLGQHSEKFHQFSQFLLPKMLPKKLTAAEVRDLLMSNDDEDLNPLNYRHGLDIESNEMVQGPSAHLRLHEIPY